MLFVELYVLLLVICLPPSSTLHINQIIVPNFEMVRFLLLSILVLTLLFGIYSISSKSITFFVTTSGYAPRGLYGGRLLTPAHFQIKFTQEKKFVEVIYSRGDGGGPYSKIVIILHRKLLCKREPYQFIG